ncbi:hypothetical protein RND81_11G087000 [Saponaria officinalis]|uniref:Uncharacterized protein n=1 Tax=Saponaria officinalis TaxID=3572 RepID=A0AAW1HJK3_SAPOF
MGFRRHPTPTHLRYLKASLFDHVNTPVLMPIIFFYSKLHTVSTSTVLDRLKNSLPDTLSMFYPLAGRFHDMNYLDCNDMGVPYIEAKVPSIYLSEVVHKADVSLLDELLPSHGKDHGGYDKLLLAIQVNTLACAMFLKTWASFATGGAQSRLPRPFFEIWKHFPPCPPKLSSNTNIANEELDTDLIKIRPITEWFMFSKAACNAIRHTFLPDYNNQNRPSLTQGRAGPALTMVLSAFIWSRVKLACTSISSDNKSLPHEVYHAINLRPQVKTLPESYYYFGNMSVNAIAKPRLQNGKENLRYIVEHYERKSREEIVSLGFSSLRSLPMYEADFGWGILIMIPGGASSEDTCHTCLYQLDNLSPDHMARLQVDQEFMSFVSKCPTLGTFATSNL